MPEIRTKDTVKAPVKTLNRAADFAGRIKRDAVRTRQAAENSVDAKENNANEYASDKIQHAADSTAQETVYRTKQVGKKAVKETKNKISDMKERANQHRQSGNGKVGNQTSNAAEKGAERFRQNRARDRASDTVRKTEGTTRKSSSKAIRTKASKTASQPIKTKSTTTAGKGVKIAGKQSFRTVNNSIKTAEKTTKAAAKTAKKTAQAAKKAAQAARAAAKAAKATAKAVVAAVKAAVKAIIAAAKAIAAAIAAGGWVAVVIIVVLLLVALILCSVFGVFSSGEDSGNGMSMRTAVSQINDEYNQKIERIKSDNAYDVLEMSGSKAAWKEVIAFYAVKLNTDTNEPQEVATIDEDKIEKLKAIFWEMTTISSELKTHTETEISEEKDADGNTVTTTTTTVTKTLRITVTHLTADEMADRYNFTQEQKDTLHELLDPSNNSLWSAVLSGVTGSDSNIVNVAIEQLGNVGGQPYWSWYGFTSRVEWCCCFVSWCENQCGYIESGVAPMYSVVDTGVNWFKDRGQWLDGSEEPRPGMIIFFDWEYDGLDGSGDHTGIVEKVEDGYVYTIEGNASDACKECMYSVGHYEILGYGYINS